MFGSLRLFANSSEVLTHLLWLFTISTSTFQWWPNLHTINSNLNHDNLFFHFKQCLITWLKKPTIFPFDWALFLSSSIFQQTNHLSIVSQSAKCKTRLWLWDQKFDYLIQRKILWSTDHSVYVNLKVIFKTDDSHRWCLSSVTFVQHNDQF